MHSIGQHMKEGRCWGGWGRDTRPKMTDEGRLLRSREVCVSATTDIGIQQVGCQRDKGRAHKEAKTAAATIVSKHSRECKRIA